MLSLCGRTPWREGLTGSLVLMVAAVVIIVFSEAEAGKDWVLHDGEEFQVKSAEVYMGDQVVLIEFLFFSPNRLGVLKMPARKPVIKNDNGKGTRLVATYKENCISRIFCQQE